MEFGFDLAPQRRVFAAFFIYSLGLGGLYSRLGDIQLKMGIGEGALGAALIGAAIGTQVSLMFAGPMIARLGHRWALVGFIPLVAGFMAVASLANGPVAMFFMLFGAGLSIGVIEIILNVEADRTEHLIGKRVMNRAHAFWSFGIFSAAAVGALAKAANIDPIQHLFGMAGLILVLSAVLLFRFKPAPARTEATGPRPRFVRPTGAILVLVVFTLSAMVLEGAGADWSVIFMRDVFGGPPFINGLAFAVGAFTQATARFFADRFVERHGPVNVARFMIATLGIGVIAVTFSPHPAIALIGFGLMGIGTSASFPLAMSAAAQRTDRAAAVNVAALAQLSFITFLLAPPLLGFVAEHLSIRYSFGIGIPLVILSWMTLKVLAPIPVSTRAVPADA